MGALIVAFGLAHPPVENPSEPLGRSPDVRSRRGHSRICIDIHADAVLY